MSVVASTSTAPKYGVAFMNGCVISKTKLIYSPSFKNCFVICGNDPKTGYAFLGHFSFSVKVQTIHSIFEKIKELGVNLQDLTNCRLMGGLKLDPESDRRKGDIVAILQSYGIFEKFDQTHCQTKVPISKEASAELDKLQGQAEEFYKKAGEYQYHGVALAPNGDLSFFKKTWLILQGKQEGKYDALQRRAQELSLQTKIPAEKILATAFADGIPVVITVLD